MDIAHIGNVAGVANTLAEAQREFGHCIYVFSFDAVLQKQFGGELVKYAKVNIINGTKVMNPTFLVDRFRFYRKLTKCDLWHYHYPYGGLKADLESRKRGHKYLKHYHGDDIRNKFDDDFCLVSTPDLLQFTPNGIWFPNPVNFDYIQQFCKRDLNPIPRVAHYPHYKNYGAELHPDYYSVALRLLEGEGKCEVVEILGTDYRNTLQKLANCDIVVGKILPNVGWFGRFELEAMALGKPVICYVSDQLYQKYTPPICRTTKDTLYEDLLALIADSYEQQILSREGMQYVKEKHDVHVLVRELDGYYERL